MNLNKLFIYTCFFIVFIRNHTISQTHIFEINNEKTLFVSLGHGINYSNHGIMFEFVSKRKGISFSTGYAPKLITDKAVVKENITFGIDLNYYFKRYGDETFYPKISLHTGWLNRYYNENNPNFPSNVDIYGIGVTGGINYHKNFFTFTGGISLDPGFLILNKTKHFSYDSELHFNFYFGIGLNLDIFRKIRENISLSLYQKNLKNGCIEKSNNKLIRGVCGFNTIYQQIYDNRYLFITFNPEQLKISQNCTSFRLDSLDTRIKFDYVDINEKADTACCHSYKGLYNNTNSTYLVAKGIVTAIASTKKFKPNKPYYITLKIKNLKLINNSTNPPTIEYFDEIIIWDILNKNFCK